MFVAPWSLTATAAFAAAEDAFSARVSASTMLAAGAESNALTALAAPSATAATATGASSTAHVAVATAR
ncbi:hypothetical protein [Actinomadura luteofluorescens]|uniref:hypothetical protein n=1 Tax=Actinomadura luteofluorescens TaxID=46163 RepID=UPI003D8E0720